MQNIFWNIFHEYIPNLEIYFEIYPNINSRFWNIFNDIFNHIPGFGIYSMIYFMLRGRNTGKYYFKKAIIRI